MGYTLVWFVFIAYAVFLTTLRELIAANYLGRIFRSCKIQVQPLHADGAGGFGFIGTHYVRVSLLVIGVGYVLSFANFLKPLILGQPINLGFTGFLLLFLYACVTLALFVVPIWSVHFAMQKSKAKLLNEISEEFQEAFEDARSSLDQHSNAVEVQVEKTKRFNELYQLVAETFPDWPYDSQTIRRFSITAILPLVLSAASLVIDAVQK
jgi:hypothetical protein